MDNNNLSIKIKIINKLRIAEVIKVNIIINKFRTFILFSFYLNIVILLKLIIY